MHFYARVGDNPDLCETADSAPSKRKKKNKFVIPVVASSIAVMILLLIFCGPVQYRRKRQGGS